MCSNNKKTFRGSLNAWILGSLDNYFHKLLGATKEKLFANHPAVIVEIGAGTGANFRYMRPGTKVIAIEPNVQMHPALRKNAAEHNIELAIKTLKGEAIDLPDNSCEYVICTLVLCSVDDPAQVVQEVKRILKPAGKFLFIEHVKAPDKSFVLGLQNVIHGPWSWCLDGCQTNRDTEKVLREAGFSEVHLENYNLKSAIVPINPQIRGYVVK